MDTYLAGYIVADWVQGGQCGGEVSDGESGLPQREEPGSSWADFPDKTLSGLLAEPQHRRSVGRSSACPSVSTPPILSTNAQNGAPSSRGVERRRCLFERRSSWTSACAMRRDPPVHAASTVAAVEHRPKAARQAPMHCERAVRGTSLRIGLGAVGPGSGAV